MSLDFSFEEIENYREVVWLPDPTEENPNQVTLNPITNALIWGTISVGIGKITDSNVDEFAARFRITERLDGPFVRKDGEPYTLTDEDFIAHIGLRTNVSNETRTQWARRIFVDKRTSDTERNARHFRREREKRAEAEETAARR